MNELVERVARAIYQCGGYAIDTWETAPETPLKARFREMARAAIEALGGEQVLALVPVNRRVIGGRE